MLYELNNIQYHFSRWWDKVSIPSKGNHRSRQLQEVSVDLYWQFPRASTTYQHKLGNLKRDIYSPTALEAISLKTRCQPGSSPSKRFRENPFLLLSASSDSWCFLAWITSTSISIFTQPSLLCLLPFSSLIKTDVTRFRAHPNLGWLYLDILNLIVSAKTPFSIKVMFAGSR